MARFEFTYNVYTGEQSQVIPPIGEVILGIAVALETDDKWVYGGNRDEQDDVMEFLTESEYIERLRWSPEYHDATMEYLLKQPAYRDFIVPQYRCNCFKEWQELMREYGVLGVIGIEPYNKYPKTDKELT